MPDAPSTSPRYDLSRLSQFPELTPDVMPDESALASIDWEVWMRTKSTASPI